MDNQIPDDKKKTLQQLLFSVLSFNEKALENFVMTSRFERLKDRQKNIFSLIDFFHYYPDLYQESVRALSDRFPNVPRSKKDIEEFSLKNLVRIFEMAFEARIAPCNDIATALKELHGITSFFETENNMDVDGSSILVKTIDAMVERTVEHIEAKLVKAVMDVMDPESFKQLSLVEIKGIQKSINHLLDTLGLDPYVEKIFNRIVNREEADSLHVITAFAVLNEFLQGHILFKEVLDESLMLSKHEKKTRLEKSLKHFEDADKNILDDENIQYFEMGRSELMKFAADLGVDSFCLSSKKRKMNLIKQRKPSSPK